MPLSCPGGQVYVIKSGDTVYQLARRFNITVGAIIDANPGLNPDNLSIGQEICIPVPAPAFCPGGTAYTIKPGDTLFALAQRFNVSLNEIITANPGINPNQLYIGQVICIPTKEPVPVPRPRCVILNPTDITPASKGMLFIEPDENSVFAVVTNVPRPTTLPGGEVYKLWVQKPTVSHPAVATMHELLPGYWVGRVKPGFALEGANVIISSEKLANTTAPAGLGVAVGNI